MNQRLHLTDLGKLKILFLILGFDDFNKKPSINKVSPVIILQFNKVSIS